MSRLLARMFTTFTQIEWLAMVAFGCVMEFGSQRSCNSLTESPKKDNVRTGSVLGPVDELTAGFPVGNLSLF